MPWTPDRYPAAMQRLPAVVRLKAIEIANALLDDGCEEGRAIRIAIASARRWAWRRAVDRSAAARARPGRQSAPSFRRRPNRHC